MKQMLAVGHIGTEATIIESNGKKNARFTLAVYDGYTKPDGTKVERTTWFTVWYRGTGLAPYLKKGAKVLVQGDHSVNLYKDNNNQYQIGQSINADTVQLLDRKESGTNVQAAAPSGSTVTTQVPDDMPF